MRKLVQTIVVVRVVVIKPPIPVEDETVLIIQTMIPLKIVSVGATMLVNVRGDVIRLGDVTGLVGNVLVIAMITKMNIQTGEHKCP